MTYTIEKITTLIGARRYGTADANIGFLLTDSRSLCFPEETLFFAFRSDRNDGHNYIPELYRPRRAQLRRDRLYPDDYDMLYPGG
jgi:UDP-N-acetylmuramyl pentapeptide synthase